MSNLRKYNEERRQKLLQMGRENPLFFANVLLGFPPFAAMHEELFEQLWGHGDWGPNWRRAVITAFRSGLKSTIASIIYPLHCGLYPERLGLKDHSTRIIGANYDNVVQNFIRPAAHLFRNGPQAQFLQWLYRHRLPEGWEGWNENTITLIRAEPWSQPAIVGKGIESDHEGAHVNLVLFDDPEGADAEKSHAENAEARRKISLATPLLQRPQRDRILVVGTPHGSDPVVWRLVRESLSDKMPDRSQSVEWDNAKRIWKVYYKPLLDANGDSAWPEVFDDETVETVKKSTDAKTWNQQYQLKEIEGGESLFSIPSLQDAMYRFTPDGKSVEYPVRTAEKERWYKAMEWKEKISWKKCRLDEMRFYLHADLIHRDDTIPHKKSGTVRPSRAAIVVVGISPDGHAFVLDFWNWPPNEDRKLNGKSAIEEQVRQTFRFHQRFGLYKASWDSIGAQVWFKAFVENMERNQPTFRELKSSGLYGPSRLLPRLSAILVEDKRSQRMHKEDVIYERLAPWVEKGLLHLHEKQQEILSQFEVSFDSATYIDLLDALAQGPGIWESSVGKVFRDRSSFAAKIHEARRDPYTGHFSPFRDRPPKGTEPPKPPEGDTFEIKTIVN